MSISVSVFASAAVVKPVRVTITISAPANPSDVKLEGGGHTIARNVEVDGAHPIRDLLLEDVRTSSDNPTSGRLLLMVWLRDDDAVAVEGSPGTVVMDTQP